MGSISESQRDEATVRAHLEAYMAAFIDTEQELIPEFEEIGVQCWLNEDSPADKR
jgi:hypothetical protein